ncbi:MAG: TlpA family protein disulfide reductase [Microthrixaceae bacterium]
MGIVVITLISASAALAVAWALLATRGSDAVPVQDALSQVDAGPVVPKGTPIAEVGAPAPDVRLDYLDGGTQQLSELQGTPVVLNFWSSTCAPCLQEMPDFQKVAAAAGDEVTVVGVDVADTEEAGRRMVERTGVRYRNARDPRSQIFAVYGGTALPRTVLIGADGKVLDTHTGALDAAGLRDLLARNDVTVP